MRDAGGVGLVSDLGGGVAVRIWSVRSAIQPKWSDQTYLDRRVDIEATIESILGDSILGPVTDVGRIGGMGHSLGGYTIAAMAGGWPSWTDSRIKAVLLSPYLMPFQAQNTLSDLKVSAMYQGALWNGGAGLADYRHDPSRSQQYSGEL